MRDKYGVAQDPYCYPGTDILRNRLCLRDSAALAAVELEYTLARAETLPVQFERFDLARLQGIHRHLFQDVYDWAGELRTVDVAKGDTRFCTWTRVEPEARRLFGQLEREDWLCALELPVFIERTADYYCELNLLHPFREGNGRAQRLLFEELIANAGYAVDWSGIGADAWIAANIAGVHLDLEPLIGIFRRVVALPSE